MVTTQVALSCSLDGEEALTAFFTTGLRAPIQNNKVQRIKGIRDRALVDNVFPPLEKLISAHELNQRHLRQVAFYSPHLHAWAPRGVTLRAKSAFLLHSDVA